jgi:hypothetical protein
MDTVVLKLWNMIKIMKVYKIAIFAGTAAAAFVLAGCGDGGTGPDNGPAFGYVSDLEPLYLAYLTNDPIYKPDTIKASFDYNFSKVKSIEVSITLDTGKSWIKVASVIPQSSNRASIAWAPLSDAANFGYFGGKRCFLKIEDPISKAAISTDSFIVVGNIPFTIDAPKGGETFRISDSINLFFSKNQDLTAELRTFVFTNINDDSTYFPLETPKLLENSWEFIKYFQTTFSLDDPRFQYDQAAMPKIKILVGDYGTQVVKKESGAITIIK